MYSRKITMPKTDQEGIINFVQMIINNLEAGNHREALLQAVDLRNDLDTGIYQVTIPACDMTNIVDASSVNKR